LLRGCGRDNRTVIRLPRNGQHGHHRVAGAASNSHPSASASPDGKIIVDRNARGRLRIMRGRRDGRARCARVYRRAQRAPRKKSIRIRNFCAQSLEKVRTRLAALRAGLSARAARPSFTTEGMRSRKDHV
jgi:hypothetical protein